MIENEIRNCDEKLLEDWLFEHPEVFEEGLRWVKRQYEVFWRGSKIGKIDLMGVDKDKNIVIVELKAVPLNHSHYSQGLCYYRSLSTHQPQGVRLIFVGPSIGTRFRIVHEMLKEESNLKVDVKLYDKIGMIYELRDYNKDYEGRILLEIAKDS